MEHFTELMKWISILPIEKLAILLIGWVIYNLQMKVCKTMERNTTEVCRAIEKNTKVIDSNTQLTALLLGDDAESVWHKMLEIKANGGIKSA